MSGPPDRTLDASAARSQASGVEAPPAWIVTLVGGPDLDALGRRRALEPGAALVLGRGGDALGPGALEDPRLSRAHASVELGAAGPLLRDLGSHNGTLVNGARVESASLGVGDVITLGRTLLLVGRGPGRPPELPAIEALVGCGNAHLAVLDAVHKVAARSTTLALIGPPGAGKSHLARVLHDQSGRSGPARTIHCASASDERVYELLAAPAAAGTLILEGVDEASAALQARLLPIIDAAEGGERIIATTHRPLEGSALRPDLVQRLSRWIIHLPPLAARLEDLPLLAQHFLRRYLGEPRILHPRLTLALLRHRWPGNMRELEAAIECLAIDAEEGDAALRLTPRVRAMLGAGPPPAVAAPAPLADDDDDDAVLIDREGRWFRLPQRERVELAHRRTLARILAALVAQRAAAPGVPSSVAELLAAGWPDERVLERAGANRVHVALTALRKLGLRELLLRRDDGYVVDPDVDVRTA
ncbi:MAG: FHA domain-containing protein [Myxococcales bacterium]|nr:FHA domain-containing protein [Myxococcales bacterium]